MEFTQYNCPVCETEFENGDDVVVCPECGTPHHRSCFEALGHCYYQDKHADGFSFESLYPAKSDREHPDQDTANFETVLCPVCFYKSPKGSHVCQRCGTDLSAENVQQPRHPFPNNSENNSTNQQPYSQNMPPFGFGSAGVPNFDPLAGMDSQEEIGDGVTAGEAAKFTGKNTPYFSMVFQRLKKMDKGKFGFTAFVFSGVYFLYRKMYGIGILFSLISIISNVLSTFIIITPEWSSSLHDISNGSTEPLALLYAYLPLLLNGVHYALMLISGLTANRLYYRHSLKKIRKIKEEYRERTPEELHKSLESKGGINLPIALSFGITMLIISYICNFFLMSSNIGL